MTGPDEKKDTYRMAVSRVHFPDGTLRYNQVLEFAGGSLVRCYPLTEELPFTEWRGGDYYIKEESAAFS